MQNCRDRRLVVGQRYRSAVFEVQEDLLFVDEHSWRCAWQKNKLSVPRYALILRFFLLEHTLGQVRMGEPREWACGQKHKP